MSTRFATEGWASASGQKTNEYPGAADCGDAAEEACKPIFLARTHAQERDRYEGDQAMTGNYEYLQHARAKLRLNEGPPTVGAAAKALHPEDNLVNRINRKVGLGITKSVGTMWCAYAFALLALVSLPAAILSHDPIIIIAWIAQTFLQLVLLPVIIVGQNIQAVAADARSAATYEDAGAILEEAKQIQLHLASQDAAIGALLDKIKDLEVSKAGD